MLPVRGDLGRKLRGRSDDVGQARTDRAPGHAVELRRRRGLNERGARFLLDCAESEGAVRTHSGKDDADAALASIFGQAPKEKVDRQTQPARRRQGIEVQNAPQNRQVLVGRDDVNVLALHPDRVLRLSDGHLGGALEKLHQEPLVRRIEVLHDDERHAALLRHVLQELFERFEPARGSPNAHDWKARFARADMNGRRRRARLRSDALLRARPTARARRFRAGLVRPAAGFPGEPWLR